MSRLTGFLYQTLFKRNSTFIATAIVGAFVFESSIHGVVNCTWDSVNKGKLWKDVLVERQSKGLSQ
ncbi:hypothetical protein SAMD00019534_062100 [Acytostelium subglobosum LB1]|uniref:hypothetical protein n=1 Tax=Acytostelium subglobosum LB1 TaxID=1410327 RepID=UPI000644EC46|nr:hypothetical protein SAMD00019534_062100 [Acytostelium subglobosum LB1]GAM23035.1 hypothetical protein SAMD00019534_062100 [Acytostelium subglobosum LB1]|eukprot:XP_012754262.1 hypothetical protein SAMD00019534_062100 [Acytostelium subglobosum LB1]